MFQPAQGNANFPEQELAIGRFWKEARIYEKSLAQRAGAPPFVFYEGPPTANGMPHPGHCLTRAIKDLFPRYKTMRGYRCERKAGWDTHGLPVEVEVCKELGIHSKEEIEAYGVEQFIQKCQQSVWRYMREWERLTERIGFWVDLEKAYVTYHQSYVESVWWSLKNLFDRGLLYQGHKIVWWWAQGGTALSAGEVGLGYREVADPSVYVKFPLLDEAGNVSDTSLLVWTTTPWTLPSNQFAAVHPDLSYSVLSTQHGEKVIVATALVEALRAKTKQELPEVDSAVLGKDLIGRRYVPPFDFYYEAQGLQQGRLQTGGTDYVAWRIVAADFVTVESGTGAVHEAPPFGEVDFDVLLAEQARFMPDEGPTLLNAVSPDGKFTSDAPPYQGQWVKDSDRQIIRDLNERGLLFHREQYLHEYPFCWRAEEDPLIQYPRLSWFIRTTEFKDAMLANNAAINWLPEHIKTGRFGKFLESNVDWALSRERYWSTPLPIWKCDATGQMEAVASFDELLAKPGVRGTEYWVQAKAKQPELPDDLKVHKPYIDYVEYDSPFAAGARMRRVPDVIDAWYDSGSMPFAQWGYQGEDTSNSLPLAGRAGEGVDAGTRAAAQKFHEQFPADFISEAIDQTRGWFYSQLAISTLLFSGGQGARSAEQKQSEIRKEFTRRGGKSEIDPPYPHPFRNCIVLGLMLGEDGQKMSKSKRNYREPNEIFDRYGADALRWYFFATQPPWTTIRYSEQAIKDSIPEFLLRLWNVYSFFVIYANIDGFDPAEECSGVEEPRSRGVEEQNSPSSYSTTPLLHYSSPSYRPVRERGELDRWILSELNRTCASVVERMDAYDNFGACQRLIEFVDALSNWYVRRSRDRFWAADKKAAEKLDAYWTLYECLVTTTKLVAPFVPFVAETMWQNLARSAFGNGVVESVHLCDYPTPDAGIIDEALSERMNLVRLISSLGRSARTSAALKVRQPLSKVEVILADTTHQAWLLQHSDVINEELNVKHLEFCDDPSQYVDHEVNPNFKLLGPKLGKLLPKVKAWLSKQSGAQLLANFRDNGLIDFEIDGQKLALTRDEVEVRIKPKPGWTSANDRGVVVVLSTELTPELVSEGLVRDAVRIIQDRRKELACAYTDRIEIGLVTESKELAAAIQKFRDYLAQETLAIKIVTEPLPGVEPMNTTVADHDLAVYVRVAK
jgi:isoleucyl-tRNA synthetase